MKTKILTAFLILFFAFSQINFILAEDILAETPTTTAQTPEIKPTPIPTPTTPAAPAFEKKFTLVSDFFKQETSNPALRIIGINEIVTYQILIIVICLLLLVIAFLYNYLSISDIIAGGKPAALILSIILTLIGSYYGLILKIAKELTSLPDTLAFIKSKGFLITFGIIAILTVLLVPLKKLIRKSQDEKTDEEMRERERKSKLLQKIKDYETDVELRRRGGK